MNKVLQPFLDRFVVVYLDDIVVYSITLEEHAQHLRQVLQVLQEVEFFSQQDCGRKTYYGECKVKVILKWEPPSKVPELRSFLGLMNYYRGFIKGYSAKAAPLMDLL